MAKDKITEYDATAANNTVVGDVNLAENSALPSDMNNAVREVMSHQKEAFGSGTPLLVDQTNNRVGIGLTAPEQLLHLRNASGNCVAVLGQFGTGTKATITAASNQVELKADSGTNDVMTFKTGSSERVRITSDGFVGIGTNNPQSLTHFKGTASGQNILHLDNSAGSAHGDTNNNVRVVAGNNGYWANLVIAGHQLEFKVQGGTSMLRVDSDGVKFNGDTAAANALDDYEEGTWTAQMLGTASNPSNTVLAASASYTKIGSLVWAGATFVGVNTTGASGGVTVTGMPFNSNFTVPMGNVMSQNTFNVGSTVANISPFWANGTTVMFYHTLHGSNIWGAVQHSAGLNRYLYLSLIYTTNS